MIKWKAYFNKEMLKQLSTDLSENENRAINACLKDCNSWKKYGFTKLSRLNYVLGNYKTACPLSYDYMSKKFGATHLKAAMIYGVDPDDGTLEKIFSSQHDCIELYSEGIKKCYKSKKDYLNALQTYSLIDVDAVLISSYLTAIVQEDKELLDSLDYHFEEDVVVLEEKIFKLDNSKLVDNPLQYKEIAKLADNEEINKCREI